MAGSNVNLAFIGEAIDRLITVPMSNWTILKGLPLMKLYQFAREKTGEPLSLKAAKMIKKSGKYRRLCINFIGLCDFKFYVTRNRWSCRSSCTS